MLIGSQAKELKGLWSLLQQLHSIYNDGNERVDWTESGFPVKFWMNEYPNGSDGLIALLFLRLPSPSSSFLFSLIWWSAARRIISSRRRARKASMGLEIDNSGIWPFPFPLALTLLLLFVLALVFLFSRKLLFLFSIKLLLLLSKMLLLLLMLFGLLPLWWWWWWLFWRFNRPYTNKNSPKTQAMRSLAIHFKPDV